MSGTSVFKEEYEVYIFIYLAGTIFLFTRVSIFKPSLISYINVKVAKNLKEKYKFETACSQIINLPCTTSVVMYVYQVSTD